MSPESDSGRPGPGVGTPDDPTVPSMLDLVRLSPRHVFPPGGVDLYRHIALLTDLSPGDELLDVACGVGTPLIYWVREYGVQGSGVDSDPAAVSRAEVRIRDEDLAESLQVQEGSPANLPYRDEIFDVVVGEMGLTADADPEEAVRELVRVAKPGGTIVLVQLVWKAPVDPRRREVLSSHLGARPLMLVELKRILREAGVHELHTEDWSDEETAFRRRVTKPFPDFAELFSLPEKLGILRRAWSRWGWKGVKTAILREREVHRLLTRERIIALDLILGTKAVDGGKADSASGGRRKRGGGERAPLPDGGPPEGRRSGDAAGASGTGAGGGRGDPESAEGAGSSQANRTDGDEGGGAGSGAAREAGTGEGEDDREREGDEDSRPVDHEETVGLPLFGGESEEGTER